MAERVKPEVLAGLRDATILDIRTREERDVMGWIPGSLHRPMESLDSGVANGTTGPIVLACASGRRSLALAERMEDDHVQILDLEGGLLAWQLSHPVCQAPESIPGEAKLTQMEFVQQIRSCFVVEAVESGALEDEQADPLGAVSELFDELPNPASLLDVWNRIDLLAFQAWRQGHRLDFIADHVAQFYALAWRLDTSR